MKSRGFAYVVRVCALLCAQGHDFPGVSPLCWKQPVHAASLLVGATGCLCNVGADARRLGQLGACPAKAQGRRTGVRTCGARLHVCRGAASGGKGGPACGRGRSCVCLCTRVDEAQVGRDTWWGRGTRMRAGCASPASHKLFDAPTNANGVCFTMPADLAILARVVFSTTFKSKSSPHRRRAWCVC